MINIRRVLAPTDISKLPLPEVMKKEIKMIPQVHCEYQRVNRESKCEDLQSSDPEIDPLSQSNVEENSSTIDVDKLHNACPSKNSSTEAITNDNSRIELTAETVSQPLNTSVHSSPVRKKTKEKIQVN